MSGIGRDGLEGAKALVAAGGTIWTQRADTCVVYGMPRACDEAGLSSSSLTPQEIRAALAELRSPASAAS
jgi:two-component system chemotaxis response regulator CheB